MGKLLTAMTESLFGPRFKTDGTAFSPSILGEDAFDVDGFNSTAYQASSYIEVRAVLYQGLTELAEKLEEIPKLARLPSNAPPLQKLAYTTSTLAEVTVDNNNGGKNTRLTAHAVFENDTKDLKIHFFSIYADKDTTKAPLVSLWAKEQGGNVTIGGIEVSKSGYRNHGYNNVPLGGTEEKKALVLAWATLTATGSHSDLHDRYKKLNDKQAEDLYNSVLREFEVLGDCPNLPSLEGKRAESKLLIQKERTGISSENSPSI